jgi:hypothetical protein
MRTFAQTKGFLSLAALFILFLSSCENPETGSLYDPNATSPKPQPTVTSISPQSGLAGVTTITIVGTNFSAVKAENTVLFDATAMQVLSATSTQLTVRAANLIKDSIRIRVQVTGASLFSNTVLCKLEAAVAEFGQFDFMDEAWGTTTDAAGNLYVSFVTGGTGMGIKKFTAAGVKSDYAPSGGVTKWSALKMGPNGELYLARILKAIYKIPAGGGSPAVWVSFGNLGTVFDMDFDQSKVLWAAGNNESVYRILQDKTVKAFPFVANVRAVRAFGGYVYFGGLVTADNAEKVVRFKIVSADSLGPQEDYFNFTASPLGGAGKSIFAINFGTDGDMFIGTDAADPIIIVHADKNAEVLHPGVLSPAMHIFASGIGSTLYAVRGTSAGGVVGTSGKIYKINPLKTLAPYYGPQ